MAEQRTLRLRVLTGLYLAIGVILSVGLGAVAASLVPPGRVVLVAVVQCGVTLPLLGWVGFLAGPVRDWMRNYLERGWR